MRHLTEEELVEAYYGDRPPRTGEHLSLCPDCRAELARITELLDEIRRVPAPARDERYGGEVWTRLQSRLPERASRWWARPWIFAPAAVALLVAAFLGGMLTMHTRQNSAFQPGGLANQAGISEKDRQRVFLGAMSDHLQRSEILLAQVLHAAPGEPEPIAERSRARDLLEENRLLRETASGSGDQAHAALLNDLERVFLDLANSPGQLSAADIAELRRRVEDQGLLFKVRVTSTDARTKGQTL
jgi:hypothetical protein